MLTRVDGVRQTDYVIHCGEVASDPRGSLHVTATDFWSYIVIDGDVTLTDVAATPGDEATEMLRSTYRAISGEHADWDEFDQAMISDRRLVIRLQPTHGYGPG